MRIFAAFIASQAMTADYLGKVQGLRWRNFHDADDILSSIERYCACNSATKLTNFGSGD